MSTPLSAANYATLANAFFDQYLSLSIKHTPLGFAYPFKWGGARGVVNTLHLAFVHSQTLLATAVSLLSSAL